MQNIFYINLKLELTFVELIFSYKSFHFSFFAQVRWPCLVVFLLNQPREYPNLVISQLLHRSFPLVIFVLSLPELPDNCRRKVFAIKMIKCFGLCLGITKLVRGAGSSQLS